MGEPQARGWLAEPLLHFAVLGGLLFAGGRWLDGRIADDRVVVVRTAELAEAFEAEQGRPPDASELQRLTENWADRELLYREGLRLGLDREDPVVKRRVVEKMEFVATEQEIVDDPDDAALQAFVDAHADRYAGPPRRDFVLVTFAGPTAQAEAQAAAQALQGGADPKSVGGRVATGKRFTPSNTRGTYGPVIADAIAAAPIEQWHAFAVDGGWSVVRVTAPAVGEKPPLDKVRVQAGLDYAETKRREAIRRRLDALGPAYEVRVLP